jgi:hypothetical protein
MKKKEQRTKSTVERTKKKTQNLVFKYKEQRAELSWLVTVIPSLLFIEKRKQSLQNFKEKQTHVPAIFSFI